MITIDNNNYELWLLRYAEGDLTADECKAVEQWLESHPEAAEELALYNEAPRLEKDESVRYTAAIPQKTMPLWPALLRWSAAAAVVAALMVPITGLNDMGLEKVGEQYAMNNNVNELNELTLEEDTIIDNNTYNSHNSPRETIFSPKEEIVTPIYVAEEHPVQQEDTVVDVIVPEEVVEPAVVYCDNLIAYESAPDTVFTNDLIAYDDSRRSWTEDVKEWAAETKLAQWVRRRIQARGNDLIAMN